MVVELIQTQLARSLTFLETFLPLVNSHMVNFITHSLFDNLVPPEFRGEIEKYGSDIALNMLFQHCDKKAVDDSFKMGIFLNSILDIHANNRSANFYTLDDFKDNLYKNGCEKFDVLPFDEFMSSKKCHEVTLMSSLIAELAHFTESSVIIDIGDGKGYLSSFLALEYKLKVLGLDSSVVKTTGAAKRNQKLHKIWKGTRKKHVKENEEDLKSNTTNIEKSNYYQTTEYISELTDLSKILLREFGENEGDVGLVGLHTCGDLSPVCLRQFVNNPNQSFLVNVGCCYHLLTENDLVNGGFPLSKYMRENSFELGRNARMLSLKPKWKIGSHHSIPNESLLYRAILQQIFVDKKGSDLPDELQVGRIAAKCSTFLQYVRMALQKLKLDIEISDEEIEEYMIRYSCRKDQLWVYFMLLTSLSSIIEEIILLDKLLFLREHGVEKSYVVEMFDPVISPRCHGIVAFRK